ncbi:hypothetical protein [Streptomyces sp. NPDC005336]|uniref:hypothetical protein n=1 Tax=Streptomyces sp. NPDC005336 TaxID=3157035 RepID=UPI0033B003D2
MSGRALRHWPPEDPGWRTGPGRRRLLVGRSAGDLPPTATTEVITPGFDRGGALYARGERES